MTFDEFLTKLNRANPFFEDLVITFEHDFRGGALIIEPKSRDLPEIVTRCKREKLFPIVDQKLGVLFGCVDHGGPREWLFRYHNYASGRERPFTDINPYESQDRWVSEGHGWFISSMRPHVIVAGIKYRTDPFDTDVFLVHKIDHQDLTREEIRALIRGD